MLDFLKNEANFKEVYKYAFQSSKQIKSLKFDDALFIWGAMLKPRFKIVEKWIEYLTSLEKSNQNDISQDLWNMLLDFCVSIKDDISKYDISSAYPHQIDDFVEWYN